MELKSTKCHYELVKRRSHLSISAFMMDRLIEVKEHKNAATSSVAAFFTGLEA
jgi:hypothetical protein